MHLWVHEFGECLFSITARQEPSPLMVASEQVQTHFALKESHAGTVEHA